jgi:signal peptidase I
LECSTRGNRQDRRLAKVLGTILVGIAVVATAGGLSGCGGANATPPPTSLAGATRTTTDPAALRKGFKAFIAAARAAGRTNLADHFTTALTSADHKGFGLFPVPSSAMAPAMLTADRVVGEPVAAGSIKRGDIVVFAVTQAAGTACGAHSKNARLIKRIIGLPGERIQLVPNSSEVLVGHTRYDVKVASPNPPRKTTVFHVPPGKLFVLGDNRRTSCDSPTWSDPYVPEANVLWKIDGIYFPPNRAALVN